MCSLPPGLISVGGYRFAARELQEAVHGIETTATLTALPNALAERGKARNGLTGLRFNPLLAGVFRVLSTPMSTSQELRTEGLPD